LWLTESNAFLKSTSKALTAPPWSSAVCHSWIIATNAWVVEPGAKVNSEYYCQHVLAGGLLPDNRARCQRYSWTLQQDSTPSRSSSLTCGPQTARTWIQSITLFWGALQQMVYQRRWFTTINQLKQAIVTEWSKLSQRFIDRATASPAWVRRPAARWTQWTFDVKTAWCDSYFRQ